MKYILINYANNLYKNAQDFNSWTGKHIAGFDKVIEYAPEDIDEDFYNKNKDILSLKRGNGMWLWKPYFIKKTLESTNEGDYVFYCDSGSYFCRNKKEFLKCVTKDDIWVTELPLIEKQFSKPALFKEMDCDIDEFKNSNQIQASFICIKNTKKTREFIDKWLELCCKKELLLPLAEDEEHGDCEAHREDQSILSLLCKKEGIIPHKDPTQFGRIPEKYYSEGRLFNKKEYTDAYKPFIVLHRDRNGIGKYSFNQWLNTWLPIRLVYKLVKTNFPK